MKTKYSFLFLFLAILSFCIVSCSNDDDTPVETEEANIVIDKDSINIIIEGSRSLNITDGNGEYSAFSVNNNVATVSLSGQVVNVQGIGIGKTSVIISDKNTQLKVVPVIVYQYNQITLEKDELIFDFLLGNEKSVELNILKGNGDYEVVSDNDQIRVSLSEDTIVTVSTVKGYKGGTANITVTDACDRKTVLKVEANATTDPYTEEELAGITGDSSQRYYFNGHAGFSIYTDSFFNTTENGMNMYGWDYYSFNWLKIYFPGDKSVGEKTGGKIDYNFYADEVIEYADLTKCKVVKNDGANIWIVYAYLDKNGVLIPGYIVSPI